MEPEPHGATAIASPLDHAPVSKLGTLDVHERAAKVRCDWSRQSCMYTVCNVLSIVPQQLDEYLVYNAVALGSAMNTRWNFPLMTKETVQAD